MAPSVSPPQARQHGRDGFGTIGLVADHAGAIDAASEQLQGAYRELLFDLMERIWNIGPGAKIERDALREYGFDPDAPEPDKRSHGRVRWPA